MQSPASDVAEIVDPEISPEQLFISLQPSTPDAVVTVYTSGGEDRAVPGIDYERTTVQIRSRGARDGYEAAYSKLKFISDVLHGLSNVSTSTSRIVQIVQKGNIWEDRYDDNNRPTLVAEFAVDRTPI